MEPSITFVVPPRRRGIHGDITGSFSMPHVGLASLSFFLEERGIPHKIVDARIEKLGIHETARKILETGTKVAGFSSFTNEIMEAVEVANLLKYENPELEILIGGYHANALPERTLEDFPVFDHLVFGEGEETLVEWLDKHNRGESVTGMDGLVTRTPAGAIVKGPDRKPLTSANLPGLRFEAFPIDRYRPMYALPWNNNYRELPVHTARGCPYSCTFCSNPWRAVRYREIRKVINEIEDYERRLNVKRILFTDQDFAIWRERLVQFCEALISEGFPSRIRWGCQGRADSVDESILRLMKKAGCYIMSFGIESGNQFVLDKTGKKLKIEDVRKTIAATRRAGILSDTQFILGLPYDTKATIRETVKFALELDPDYVSFAILTPFPGSRILEMAKKGEGGLKLLSEDWRLFGKQVGGALESAGMSRKAIEREQLKAYLRFYIRPSKIPSLLRIASPLGMVMYALRSLINTVRLRQRYKQVISD